MKRTILISFMLFTSLFPQSRETHLFIPGGFLIESLSGYGYSRTLGTPGNIAAMNPAAASRFTSATAGATYQYEPEKELIYFDIPVERYRTNLPQSAGFIIPVKSLHVGAGFTKVYDASIEIGPFPVATIDQPEGTGEYGRYSERTDVTRFSAIISYIFSNVFREGDILSAGISLDYDQIRHLREDGVIGKEPDFQVKSHGYKLGSSIGLIYQHSGSAYSINYKSGLKFDKMTIEKYKNVYPYFKDQTDLTASIEPEKIHCGFDHRFRNGSLLTSTLSYIFWKSISKYHENNLEAAASYIFAVNEMISASGGLYYTDYNLNEDYNVAEVSSKYNALFMTAGIILKYKLIEVDLAIADSHLLSGVERKQTMAKIGMAFIF